MIAGVRRGVLHGSCNARLTDIPPNAMGPILRDHAAYIELLIGVHRRVVARVHVPPQHRGTVGVLSRRTIPFRCSLVIRRIPNNIGIGGVHIAMNTNTTLHMVAINSNGRINQRGGYVGIIPYGDTVSVGVQRGIGQYHGPLAFTVRIG